MSYRSRAERLARAQGLSLVSLKHPAERPLDRQMRRRLRSAPCRAGAVGLMLVGVTAPAFAQTAAAPSRSLPGDRASPAITGSQTKPPAASDPRIPDPRAPAEMTLELEVVAQRLDTARSQIQPSLGATTYDFNRAAIESQPQGDNTPLNQLVLQAPGVAQDSFGQLHVRGDHANLQYRLNGVQLPEGINVFGQTLETRLASSVSLITGALPAQYGFRTAGIIDIQTKTGSLNPGGAITLYGGGHETLQPSFEWGGRVGQVDYFVTGEYLHNSLGIENPVGTYDSLHDRSDQGRGFAYLSGIIDPTTRLTAILGTSRSQFQIPNTPGQSPGLGLTVNGTSDFGSQFLNENQREITHYAIVALQKQLGAVDLQVSAFNRYSSLYFSPDPTGDLLFNGIAQSAYRRSIATGVQGDGSYRLSDSHTLRSGFLIQGERSTGKTISSVLALDSDGAQISDQPVALSDEAGKTGWLYGLYLQDEWKILPNVTVNYGARFDLVDQYTHENQLSPRINVVWQPFETTALHAGYSRYFTPPPFELVTQNAIGNLAGTTGSPSIFQNSVARAERAHYFDAGISQVLLPGLKAGVDVYYKVAKNLIDEGQFGAPIILTPFNYEKGLVRGAEATISYQADNLAIYGNFAVSKALGKRINSGQFNFDADELAFINDHYIHLDHDQTYTASAGIAYTLPTKTRLSLDLLYGSGLRADGDHPNGSSLPDYAQFNLGVTQRIDTGLLKGVDLRLDVINLFDKVYQIRSGTGVGVGAPQFGMRRTVLAGVTTRF